MKSCARRLAVLLLGFSLHAQSLRLGVDPRVELMSILFRLAGNPEYSQCKIPAYAAAIDRRFGPFREHAAVRLARELRQTDGVAYDAVMSLAIHTTDTETLSERVPFERAAALDERWHGAKARRFLEAARKFATDTNFTGFLRAQQPYYDAVDARVQEYVAKNTDLGWFDRFFGPREHAPFHLVMGLTNGDAWYGPRVVLANGVEEIYAIAGVGHADAQGLPTLEADWWASLVHEFSHSYCNPLVDRFWPQLEKPGGRLYTAFRTEMGKIGYGEAKSVLYESLVRASVSRYVYDHEGPNAALHAANGQRAASFLWTTDLLALFGQYAQERALYPTLEAFMPQVVALFERVAAHPDQLKREYDESCPKIAGMNIANGARDVDPSLKAIEIRFDRPMNPKSYSDPRKGGFAQSTTAKAGFDEAGRVFTIPVTLEPDKVYAFGLNNEWGGSFQTPDGIQMKGVQVKFRTRAAQ